MNFQHMEVAQQKSTTVMHYFNKTLADGKPGEETSLDRNAQDLCNDLQVFGRQLTLGTCPKATFVVSRQKNKLLSLFPNVSVMTGFY